MKIRITGYTHLKLAFVKKIKELTGMGLKEAKEWCDDFDMNRNGTNSVNKILDLSWWYNSSTYSINDIKKELDEIGITVLPLREEALSEILDKVYESDCKFLVIFNRLTYKVIKGDYKFENDKLVVTIEEGARNDIKIFNKKVILPKDSILEESINDENEW